MKNSVDIQGHYTSGTLWARLCEAVAEDGIDIASASVEDLAPYDHFHGRGLEATVEMADALEVHASHHLLDVGSGLGGPARYMATRFGCRVSGVDLTGEFCEVAVKINELLGLSERVAIRHASALELPFEDGTFDGVYSMNVSMNIADKSALYREMHRVMRPAGWLALSEIAAGPNEGLQFPTPWASSADASFLVTPDATRAGLEANGFEVISVRDALAQGRDYAARSRALIERGEKPMHRAVGLVHPDVAATAAANSGKGTKDGCTIPIEVLCRRKP